MPRSRPAQYRNKSLTLSLMFCSCLLQVGIWQEISFKRILKNNFRLLNFSPSREPRSINIFLHLRIFSTLRNFFFAHYGNLPYGSHCYMYLFLLQYELIRSCGEVFGNFVNGKIKFAGKDLVFRFYLSNFIFWFKLTCRILIEINHN